jgi:hydroxyacylglutathione hydrolase
MANENARKLNDVIYYFKEDLFDYLPAHVPFVKGGRHSAWIDTGAKTSWHQLLETMEHAKVKDEDVRLVVHTHSHADHIGNNVALKQKTGCLIASHGFYAKWHTDVDAHYQGYCRSIPELMPDTADLRAGVVGWFDSPHSIDIYIDHQNEFDLGGGVRLTGLWTPGHMKNDISWFEHSTKTLILGDSILVTDWPHFHMYLTVAGARQTIRTVKSAIRDLDAKYVFSTHMGPLTPEQALQKADDSSVWIDKVEANVLQVMKSRAKVTMEELWTEVCARVEKAKDFMGLPSVHAHVEDLIARGVIKELSRLTYSMR